MKVTGHDDIKHRQLTLWDLLPTNTAERENITGVCESPRITETDITNRTKQKEGLLEQILTPENLELVYRQVKKNKGAGGMDDMQVDELLPFLKEHKDELLQALWDGKYRPKTRTKGRNTQRERENEKAGDPHRRGQTDPTSHNPGTLTNLRKAILRQQLWVPTEPKRS